MSKRDHKASENDWRSNPSHNTRRDYPARRSTVAKWIALAVAVMVLVWLVGGQ